jgi:hypothetical protein
VIYIRPRYERAFQSLSPRQQSAVNSAVGRLESVFGHPHQHSSLGIRAFGRYFELRAGLDLRILFLPEGGDLFLCFVGNHDQVRSFIRGN